MTVAAVTLLSAPFFLIDVAALLPNLFILGSSGSVLGGGDVLGDTQYDLLAEVSVGTDEFPPFPRVLVSSVGITIAPKTGRLTAISGQVFAFLAGSKVQFNLQTYYGSQFSVLATYDNNQGRSQNVFVG